MPDPKPMTEDWRMLTLAGLIERLDGERRHVEANAIKAVLDERERCVATLAGMNPKALPRMIEKAAVLCEGIRLQVEHGDRVSPVIAGRMRILEAALADLEKPVSDKPNELPTRPCKCGCGTSVTAEIEVEHLNGCLVNMTAVEKLETELRATQYLLSETQNERADAIRERKAVYQLITKAMSDLKDVLDDL